MSLLVPAARVLVRAPSWLGDFVAAEPVLRALVERFGHAGREHAVSIAAPAPFLALLDGGCPGARRIPAERGRTAGNTAWRGHDVALLLDGSPRSAWTAWRAGIPERAGWSGAGKSALLTVAIDPPRERGGVPLGLGVSGSWPRRLPRPFGAACVELAQHLGLDVRDRIPRLAPGAAALQRARARLAALGLDPQRGFVLVNAGARPGSAKGADPAVLAAGCADLDLPLALVCAPGEEAAARACFERLPRGRGALLDDPPPALPELVALIALARLVVTPDSGPRHLARALGTPAVVLCGPTDLRHTAEHGARERVLRVEVACGPCHREVCPLAAEMHHACMRAIPAPAVRAEARALVGDGRGR